MTDLPKYSTLAELISAAQDGTLPTGFSVTLDNDSVYAYAGGTQEDWDAHHADPGRVPEPYTVDVLSGELADHDPRSLLALLLTHLGIPNARP